MVILSVPFQWLLTALIILFFTGFAGIAIYSFLSGFFGCAVLFVRSLVMQELKGTKDNQVVTKDNQVVIKDNQVATKHNQVVTKHNQVVTKHNQVATKDNQVVTKDNQVATKDNQVATKDNQVAAKLANNHAAAITAISTATVMEPRPIDKDTKAPTLSHDNLVSLFGLYNFVVGIGTLVLPVATGSMVDAFASVKIAFLFQCCCHIFCALALGLALFLSKQIS